jgi:hypothetical protein
MTTILFWVGFGLVMLIWALLIHFIWEPERQRQHDEDFRQMIQDFWDR